MPTGAFRPRSTTEILDAAIRLLRRHLAPLATLGALAMLPAFVLSVVMATSMDPMDPDAALPPAFGWMLPAAPLYLAWYAVMDAALLTAASDAYLGREVSVAASLRHALSRAWAAIGSTLLKWLIILAGLVLISIPLTLIGGMVAAALGETSVRGAAMVTFASVAGMVAWGVYFFARYFAVPATAVLEGLPAVAALRRGRELARGETAKIVRVFLLVFVILALVSLAVVAASLALQGMTVVAQILSTLPYLLIYPMIDVVVALLYYDIRARREGYDIELMARELSGAGQSAY